MASDDLFTERETAVIGLLIRGMSNKQMALRLGVSVRTIEFHLTGIYAKLAVSSRAEAIVRLAGIHRRESTVEEGQDLPQDTPARHRTRSIPMKTRAYIGAASLAVALAVLFLLTNAPFTSLTQEPPGTPPLTVVSVPPTATGTTSTEAAPPPPTPEFLRLSPASIVTFAATEITIQASLFVRDSCLQLDIDITGFWPSTSPLQQEPLVTEITFLDAFTAAPIEVREVLRGGGGGGGEGAPTTASASFTYDVKSPLPDHVAAIVTFHQAVGITQPVQFDLQPTPRPHMYCPQLPLTTPEG